MLHHDNSMMEHLSMILVQDLRRKKTINLFDNKQSRSKALFNRRSKYVAVNASRGSFTKLNS